MGSPVKAVPVLLAFTRRAETEEKPEKKTPKPLNFMCFLEKKVNLWLVILVDFFLLYTFLQLHILKCCHLRTITTTNSNDFTSSCQKRD